MMLITRFFFAVLILLQVAMPFLHAHKSSAASLGKSIHLPELEHFNTRLKSPPKFVAPTNHDDSFIAVSSGIKTESLKSFQIEDTVLVLLIGLFFMVKVTHKPCYVLRQTEPISNAHFLNLISPRAPPFRNVS